MSKFNYRKTPAAKRGVYEYHFVTGICQITIEQVGADMLHRLHLLDDNEVYNNIKNSRPKLETRQKKAIKEWEEQHPGEKVPKNWNLSLDGLLETKDADHSSYMKKIADMRATETADPCRELLYECVEYLNADAQKLFYLRYCQELTQKEIAQIFGLSQMTISKRLQKLDNILTKMCREKI